MTVHSSTRSPWGLGDYHRFAKETIWARGAELVKACRITTGQRVLDVAAGTGNTAIRAAEAGADVVACDLTPEHFDAGRSEARARGVQLKWVEADAQALPFADEEFDVVTSSFGAMFASDHQAVADEMLRVCRHGGSIGMVNFTPEGLLTHFLEVTASYAPSPPTTLSPTLWGSEDHLRALFGDRAEFIELSRRQYVERAATPSHYVQFYKHTFGPVVATYSSLADQPDRVEALDRDFLDFARRFNSGPPAGPAEYRYEYLLVIARRRAEQRHSPLRQQP
jgi:ubiquinone/menaquinone biosynthesis C-methylase UbiE